jgi:transposase
MKKDSKKGEIKVLGIDLGKQSFQLHGVDKSVRPVLQKKLARAKLVAFVAQLPPCLIGLEA